MFHNNAAVRILDMFLFQEPENRIFEDTCFHKVTLIYTAQNYSWDSLFYLFNLVWAIKYQLSGVAIIIIIKNACLKTYWET